MHNILLKYILVRFKFEDTFGNDGFSMFLASRTSVNPQAPWRPFPTAAPFAKVW